MDNILAITIGVLAVIGVGIGFASDSSAESSSEPKRQVESNQALDSDQPDSNEAPPLTGNPYQDTRIVGGKRKKTKRKRRKKH